MNELLVLLCLYLIGAGLAAIVAVVMLGLYYLVSLRRFKSRVKSIVLGMGLPLDAYRNDVAIEFYVDRRTPLEASNEMAELYWESLVDNSGDSNV